MFFQQPTTESIERALVAQAQHVFPAERVEELRARIHHLANMMCEIDSHRLSLRELPDPNLIDDRSGK